jgi:PAS domain S-box-containing protein
MPASSRDQAVAGLTAFQDRLDEAWARGRSEYDRVFDNAPGGIGVHEIDVHRRIMRVNPEELRLLGYRESEMVGKPAMDFIVMQEVSQRAIDKKLAGSVELKPFVRAFRRKDGSAITLMLLDRHLRTPSGQIAGIRTAMTEVDASAAAPERR